MSFKVIANDVSREIKAGILGMGVPVRVACTKAIIAAGTKLAIEGAADIGRGVSGRKFPAGWHVRYYQTEPASIDAAAWAYHKIPWASVFEDGATIHAGKRAMFLWIPLRTAPRFFGGGKITPRKLQKKRVKLFPIFRAGKVPLLATKVFATAGEARGLNTQISAKRILSGRRSDKGTDKAKLNRKRVTVPLFFGVLAVTLKKRFHIKQIADAQRDQLPNYYDANLNVDDR